MGATFIESGSESGNLTPYTTVGTVTSATDQSKTGQRSIKMDTTAGNAGATASVPGVMADAGRRASVWFRFATLPAGTAAIVAALQSNGTTIVVNINLTTGGLCQLNPLGPTAVNGTTVLAVNTWYRVSLSYYITNTTTFTFKAYLNGGLEATVNTGTLTNTTSAMFQLRHGTAWGASRVAWYDDIYVDDGASSGSQPDVDSPCYVPYGGLSMLGVSALG